MASYWLCAEQIFDGHRLIGPGALRVENGKVAALSDQPQQGHHLTGCLSAGFIDLQVNGGGGVMFNDAPSPQTLARMAGAHRGYGTVAILPTLISDRPEVLAQAVEAVIAAKAQKGLLGLHIEGPHIAMARRGTHHADHLRPLDAATIALVRHLRQHDLPVMITLAPEAATLPQIAELAALGTVVALGHTDATASQTTAAIAAGARCGTHLFNAMSQMQGRAPGAVGAILDGGIPFSLICDGHHVDDQMIRLALRASKEGCGFAVSDAMATVGGPDHFTLYGQKIALKKGRLVNAEGNLAGAHLTLAEAVARLVRHVGVSREAALRMAITVPAKVIGRPDLAGIAGRDLDDLVMIGDDLDVTPLSDHKGVPG